MTNVNNFRWHDHREPPARPQHGKRCKDEGNPSIGVLCEFTVFLTKNAFCIGLKVWRKVLVANEWRITYNSIETDRVIS